MSNVRLQVQEWSASENARATLELQPSTKVWPEHTGDQKVGCLTFMRTTGNLCACVKDESGLHRLFMKHLLFRCSPNDAGEYKVIARSHVGEAMTFGILVVNCE